MNVTQLYVEFIISENGIQNKKNLSRILLRFLKQIRRRLLFRHLFLLDFVVDDVAGGQFLVNVL